MAEVRFEPMPIVFPMSPKKPTSESGQAINLMQRNELLGKVTQGNLLVAENVVYLDFICGYISICIDKK